MNVRRLRGRLEAAILDEDSTMPRPLKTADLPEEVAPFAEAQISAGRFASVDAFIVAGMNAIKEREHSKLAALRAAIDEGEASGLAEDGSFARVRARLGIATR
jgi:antitoxin ParD1/3/4